MVSLDETTMARIASDAMQNPETWKQGVLASRELTLQQSLTYLRICIYAAMLSGEGDLTADSLRTLESVGSTLAIPKSDILALIKEGGVGVGDKCFIKNLIQDVRELVREDKDLARCIIIDAMACQPKINGELTSEAIGDMDVVGLMVDRELGWRGLIQKVCYENADSLLENVPDELRQRLCDWLDSTYGEIVNGYPLSRLELKQIVCSELGVLVVFDSDEMSTGALASLFNVKNNLRVWHSLPGYRGVAIELPWVEEVARDRTPEIMQRQKWLDLVADAATLPAILGVDFLAKDLVLDLAQFSCLYCIAPMLDDLGCLLESILTPMFSVRSPSDLKIAYFDFLERFPDFKIPRGFEFSTDFASGKDQSKAETFIAAVENEKVYRKRLLKTSGCKGLCDLRERVFKVPHVVVVFRNVDIEALRGDGLYDRFCDLLCDNGLSDLGIHLVVHDYKNEDADLRFSIDWRSRDSRRDFGLIVKGSFWPSDSCAILGSHEGARMNPNSQRALYRSPYGEISEFFLKPIS